MPCGHGAKLGTRLAIAHDFATSGGGDSCVHATDKFLAVGEPVAQHEFEHALRR